MAINLDQPYSATNNGQPTINPQQLAEQYGWAYSFLSSVPELNTLFKQAVAQSWDATRFQATQQVTYGWNADQTNQALSKYIKLNGSGAFGGQAGQNAMALNELAYNNGVSIPPSTMQNLLQSVAGNKTSMEDLQGYVRNMAASKFPALAKQIAAGENVSSLAAPYTNAMQNTLEVGPGQANLTDPLIQRALNGLDSTGQPNGMNVEDFQKLLRAQPAWAKTQNAQSSTMAAAHQILSAFGFS